MKKKGFTLIELLAVIVILAVIALIATPAVLNIIEDSRKSGAEASARNIASTAETYYMSNLAKGQTTSTIDLSDKTLNYNGDQATKGYITFDNNGNASGRMYVGGYCVTHNVDNTVTSTKTDEDECEIEIPKNVSGSATFTDGITLSWEELKLEENGAKYGYNASVISDDEIGAEAFMNCSTLVNLIIPEGIVSVGGWAFEGCENLLTVTIPASVTLIDGDAFMYTDNLKSISVDSNNLSYCSINDILYTKDLERLMWCPAKKMASNLVVPNGVKIIGDYAFYWNESIENIILPSGVTTIEDNAFSQCSGLTTITIPKSVISIGIDAFDSTSITTINYTGTVEQWNSLLENDLGGNNGCLYDANINYNYSVE